MANKFKDIDYSILQNPLLEDLYYMLADYADFGANNEELIEHGKDYEKRQKEFEDSLNYIQKSWYTDLIEDWSAELAIHTKQSFIYGYKVAVKLLLKE